MFKMKILKSNRYVFSAFLLIFLVNIGLATKGQENKVQSQEQQEGRKSDQTMIRPDGDYGSSIQQPEYQEEERSEDSHSSAPSEASYLSPEKTDSLEDDSVSKYNFIFYFLYKLKYEAEESP